ncbi:MAG TPA: hypothetical protein VFZ01_19930 [Geminicoccaceae bacterium]
MTRAYRRIGLLGALAVLLLVQGCREEEQGQILFHEKGVYQGQADEPLDDERLDELRSRARAQKF